MYTVYNDIALISDNWKEEGRGEGKKKKRKKRALEIWKLLPPRRALSRYTEYPEASRYYYLRTLSYSIILGLMEDSVRDKPSVWKKAIIKKKKGEKRKRKRKRRREERKRKAERNTRSRRVRLCFLVAGRGGHSNGRPSRRADRRKKYFKRPFAFSDRDNG